MAKWGEGDPRWIVEERADATNVNNWHWLVCFCCGLRKGTKYFWFKALVKEVLFVLKILLHLLVYNF